MGCSKARTWRTNIVSCAACLTLTACETPPARKNAAGQPVPLPQTAAAEAPPAAPASPPPTISSLAEQAQRDVDAILAARSKAAAAGGNGGGDAAVPSLPASGPATVPTIIWNDSGWAAAVASVQPARPQQQDVPALSSPSAPDSNSSAPASSPPANQTEDSAASPTASNRSGAAQLEPNRVQNLLVDLSRELYAQGAYSQQPMRELAALSAMCMIDPDRKLQPQALPNLSEDDRVLIGHLQEFFSDLRTGLGSGSDSQAATLAAANKLRNALTKEPQLRLPTASLCTRVGGFGDYTPVSRNSFLAHGQTRAIVYLEIEEFTSELNQQGEYITQLSQQLTIYADRDGIPVWKEDWQAAIDRSKKQRQDFFTVQVISLPQALSVGKYHLKVRVRDEKSGAEAETSIPFEMVADPKLAATGK